MKFFFTKEQKWLEKWDEFIINNDTGSHLQLSDWLKSYNSYGFDFEVLICEKNDVIIGGFGAVIPKFFIFKFYIVSYGPICVGNNIELLNSLIEKVSQRASEVNACYFQINLPIVKNNQLLTSFLIDTTKIDALDKLKKGNLFKYVFSLNGFNWIDLSNYNDSESLLIDFKSSVRRDIRSSNRKELVVKKLVDLADIKTAYNLCENNAKKGNYSLRDWNDFNDTLINLIKKNHAILLAAYKNNEMKGAILLLKSGNFYTYILGGTVKETPDLLVGHFLQWEAIKLSIDEKCRGYNISLGGSKGVVEFKNSFNTNQIYFENSSYYKVTKPFLFKLFLYFEKYLKKYKKRISNFLSLIRKAKK